MGKNQKLIHNLYWVLLSSFLGIIFLADYLTPVGMTTGVLYVLPIISCTFLFSSKKDLYATLVVITCLILLGYNISPEVPELWKELLNRGLTLFIAWASGLLCYIAIVHRAKSEVHHRKFETVLEATPNGMVMINKEGEIVLMNKQTEVMFGYARDELMGKRIEMLVPAWFRKAHPGHRKGFFGAPSTRSMGEGRDLFGLNKNGKEIPIEIDLNSITTDEGISVLVSIIDITERKNTVEREKELAVTAVTAKENLKRAVELDISNKNLEKTQIASINIMKDLARRRKEIEQSEKQLKETQGMLVQAGKMSAMGQLGAGIAHELNQPLAAIRGYSQVIDGELADDDPHKDDLKKIINMTIRMAAIIDNVRAFARDSKGEKREPTDIHKSIDDALMLVNQQLKHQSIEVIRDYNKEIPDVLGNTQQLQQVFINLITNAIDELEKQEGKRKIVITTATGDEKQNVRDPPVIEVIFKNNGPTISIDAIGMIFNPFFTTKEVGKGTGLGLSISYGIIRDHNGRIEVANLKEGVEFRITLPVA